MPGPAPKHPDERRRRNAAPTMVQLPAEGRKGAAPRWPLGKTQKGETDAWRAVWKTPQSVAWERMGPGVVRTVARYVRLLVEAEKPGASSTLAGEVRQLEDRLGLTPMAMLRLRWEIVQNETAVAASEESAKKARSRMRAVDPDAVAGS